MFDWVVSYSLHVAVYSAWPWESSLRQAVGEFTATESSVSRAPRRGLGKLLPFAVSILYHNGLVLTPTKELAFHVRSS